MYCVVLTQSSFFFGIHVAPSFRHVREMNTTKSEKEQLSNAGNLASEEHVNAASVC